MIQTIYEQDFQQIVCNAIQRILIGDQPLLIMIRISLYGMAIMHKVMLGINVHNVIRPLGILQCSHALNVTNNQTWMMNMMGLVAMHIKIIYAYNVIPTVTNNY